MATQVEGGNRTFVANDANIAAFRRVKLSSASGHLVELAGSGEVHIGVVQPGPSLANGNPVTLKLASAPGTVKVVASAAITIGATVYGAANGKVSSASAGSAIGIALDSTGADGDIFEMLPFNVLSTTAATTSIADSGGFTATTTVEAALAEIYQDILSIQQFLPVPLVNCRRLSSGSLPTYIWEQFVPLQTLREVSSNDIPSGGGILATDTTPALEFVNGDTDSQIRLLWAASNSDAVTFQVNVPERYDEAAALTLKLRGEMGGATDTPTVTVESFFNEGDTKVSDATSAFTDTVGTFSATIAAADIPASAKTLSIELTPGAHTTDTLIIYAISLEWTLINSEHGNGMLGRDSTPALNTANGDTDGAFELTWAASDTTPIGFQVPLPPNIDEAKDLVIHFRAKMGGATDTPTISCDSYFNEADTKITDTSTALGSSYAEETITIAAADVPSGAQTLSVELTPGAHTTDNLKISAIWIEYASVIRTS